MCCLCARIVLYVSACLPTHGEEVVLVLGADEGLLVQHSHRRHPVRAVVGRWRGYLILICDDGGVPMRAWWMDGFVHIHTCVCVCARVHVRFFPPVHVCVGVEVLYTCACVSLPQSSMRVCFLPIPPVPPVALMTSCFLNLPVVLGDLLDRSVDGLVHQEAAPSPTNPPAPPITQGCVKGKGHEEIVSSAARAR